MGYNSAVMNMRCCHCGEQLLGAVNKCWRCGQAVEARTQQVDPPVVVAALAEEPVPDAATSESEPIPTRVGSPFARTRVGTWRHWRYAVAREINGSLLAAWMAAILAIYGWVLLSVSAVVALALAVVAVGLGIWGLWSRYRPVAVLGVGLACLLLALSGYRIVVELFIWQYGYHPFVSKEYSETWPPAQPR